jgi:hypothetical protein
VGNKIGVLGKLGIALGIIVPVEGKLEIEETRNTDNTTHPIKTIDNKTTEIESAASSNANNEIAKVNESTETKKDTEAGQKEPLSIGKVLTDWGIIESVKRNEIPTETTPNITIQQKELGSIGKLCTRLGLIEPISHEENKT